MITQRNPSQSTSNTITIQGDGTANFTIKDINISANGNGINVDDISWANITAEGNNTVKSDSADHAGIHVSDGRLGLNVTEGSTVTAVGGDLAAGIGSNEGEDLYGHIAISGPGTVNATGGSCGAGIGSGVNGEVMGGSLPATVSSRQYPQVTELPLVQVRMENLKAMFASAPEK